MDDNLPKLLTTPMTDRNARTLERLARRRLERDGAAFVADLGIGLVQRHRPTSAAADAPVVFDELFGRLVRLLAVTRGPGHVDELLRLLVEGRPDDPEFDRYAASLLACCQAPADLAVVYAEGAAASEELRACLLQELVLRGVPVAETPGIASWATSPHWRDHPLGALPLVAAEPEREPDLPAWSVDGSSCGLPYPDPEERHPAPRLDAAPVAAVETTTDATARAMASAVANWADHPEEPEGRVEARTFALAEPLDAEAVPAVLVRLGLDCLSELGELPKPGARTAFGVVAVEPAEVWQLLFAASSTGGAYDSACYGAYGRLHAWRSLAALAGAPADAPPSEVEASVRACSWYCFGADTPWFHRVVWDLGVLTVSPDGRHLAVLAATTTD
ncbi:hypothetical protein SAMN05216371_1815 [Streptomyces sp. TLI_053]|uniref:DUF6183 family protein n=1 Tax=Streptomyces sp. TLI_053 TaxID=1855352 RepID=UPI000879B35E|nr:DUF6183 family protein [Streptomyces sp. TLI_053]SDT29891.1 hypothetical protein SAMN05216371_1815 [Streptomyces sp. TLI_053]